MTIGTLLRKPTGYLPLVTAVTATALMVGHLAIYGTIAQPDEGAAAHVFQFLVLAELPLIGLFGARWIPDSPRPALRVMAFQFVCAMVPVALAAFLEAR